MSEEKLPPQPNKSETEPRVIVITDNPRGRADAQRLLDKNQIIAQMHYVFADVYEDNPLKFFRRGVSQLALILHGININVPLTAVEIKNINSAAIVLKLTEQASGFGDGGSLVDGSIITTELDEIFLYHIVGQFLAGVTRESLLANLPLITEH